MSKAKFNTTVVVGKDEQGKYIRKYFSANTKEELEFKVTKYKSEHGAKRFERWVKVIFYQ